MNAILETAAGNPENEDRGAVMESSAGLVLVVADGAGGRSGGAEAATMAVEFLRQNASLINSADSCAQLLSRMDAAIANDSTAGETACAFVVASPSRLIGASVGDSGVWLIPESGAFLDLTRGQQRKPFIGSGAAWPVPFEHPNPKGSLLLATDGLLKYTSAERIIAVCREQPAETAAQRLIELVRYQSGALPDDVTLILCKL